MYRAEYVREHMGTGETVVVSEIFSTFTDAEIFIAQVRYLLDDYESDWYSRGFAIEELA